MTIKSIDIENFGNLSKIHFDFSTGLNAMIKENGYGKSTICAFIKALFYGLDERGRIKDTSKCFDRERYFPWSKNKCGGSLVFSFNQKDYKITRFFDEKKQSEDVFVLYDESTKKKIDNIHAEFGIFGNVVGNLAGNVVGNVAGTTRHAATVTAIGNPRHAATPENQTDIGSLIFGINKDSFERSCFMNLDILKVPSLNDDISAKLNNILQSGDDIGNFEKAKDSLKDAIKKLSGKGENTKKTLITKKIEKLNNEILNSESIEKSLPQLESYLQNSKNEKQNISEKIKALENEKINVVLFEQQKIYNDLKNQIQNDQKNIELLKEYFNNDVPSSVFVQNIKKMNSDLIQAESELQNNIISDFDKQKFAELQSFFYPNAPTTEKLEEIQRLNNQKKVFMQNNSDTKIRIMEKAKQLESQKIEIEQKIDMLESQNLNIKKTLKKRKTIFICLGISVFCTILSFVCGFFGFANNLPISFGCLSLSLVLLCCALLVKPKNRSFVEEDLIAQKTELLLIENLIKENESNAQNDAEAENAQKIEATLKDFFAQYKEKLNADDFDEILSILRTKVSVFEELSKRIPRFENAKNKQLEINNKISECLQNYKTNKTLSFENQIDELQKNLLVYENECKKIEDDSKKLADFEAGHDNLQEILTAQKTENSSSFLQSQIEQLNDELQKLTTNINSYENRLEEYSVIIDKKAEYEVLLKQSKDELKQIESRVDILEKTTTLLEKAKENLSAKYFGKMKNAFYKYLHSLDNNKTIDIDSDLNISVQGEGLAYDKNYLSEGYKDIVNFCTRLALVDAMFEEEKPLIVLDDPFINLDKDKIQNALNIVKEVSKSKQVLYFTCHESRNAF